MFTLILSKEPNTPSGLTLDRSGVVLSIRQGGAVDHANRQHTERLAAGDTIVFVNGQASNFPEELKAGSNITIGFRRRQPQYDLAVSTPPAAPQTGTSNLGFPAAPPFTATLTPPAAPLTDTPNRGVQAPLPAMASLTPHPLAGPPDQAPSAPPPPVAALTSLVVPLAGPSTHGVPNPPPAPPRSAAPPPPPTAPPSAAAAAASSSSEPWDAEKWGPRKWFESTGDGEWKCKECNAVANQYHIDGKKHQSKLRWWLDQHRAMQPSLRQPSVNVDRASMLPQAVPQTVSAPLASGLPGPAQTFLAVPSTAHMAASTTSPSPASSTPAPPPPANPVACPPPPSPPPSVHTTTPPPPPASHAYPAACPTPPPIVATAPQPPPPVSHSGPVAGPPPPPVVPTAPPPPPPVSHSGLVAGPPPPSSVLQGAGKSITARTPPEAWGNPEAFVWVEERWCWRCLWCDQDADDAHIAGKRHKGRKEWHTSGSATENPPGAVPFGATSVPPSSASSSTAHATHVARPTLVQHSWLVPIEDFEVAEFDHGVFEWKCKLCSTDTRIRWATSKDHVDGREHKENMRERRRREISETKAKKEAAAAKSRTKARSRGEVLRVEGMSPRRTRIVCKVAGADAADDVCLPIKVFENWPLLPRPGDHVMPARGALPAHLTDPVADMNSTERDAFLKGFHQRASQCGWSTACGEMSTRYKLFMRKCLQDLDARGDEACTRDAQTLLLILRDLTMIPDIRTNPSSAQSFLKEAARSPFVREILPALIEDRSPPDFSAQSQPSIDSAMALDFAEALVHSFPSELCHVRKLLGSAVHLLDHQHAAPVAPRAPGLPNPALSRLLRMLETVGDTLAQAHSQWDYVSWRRLPPVPELLNGDVIDCSKLPIATPEYASLESYLDVMYRLHRANCFMSLQRGVRCVVEGRPTDTEMRVYRARICECGVQTHGAGGFVVVASFEMLDRSAKRPRSRALLYGSLVCLSLGKAAFSDVVWARVLERRPPAASSVEAVLEFPPDLNSKRGCRLLITLLSASGRPLLAAEAPVFFPAHDPVLRVLQRLDASQLPLRDALLGGEHAAARSSLDAPGAGVAEKSLQKLLAKHTAFTPDETQRQAMTALVRRRLAVVQGPPGTGKTFVGVQACEVLARKLRDADDDSSDSGTAESDAEGVAAACGSISGPVLLLSYKRHALDEMLTKCERFTQKIVRLGGTSSDNMAKYNLRDLLASLPRDKFLGRQLRENIEARGANRDAMVAAISELFLNTVLPQLVLSRASIVQLEFLVKGCQITQNRSVLEMNLSRGDKRGITSQQIAPYVMEWLREAQSLAASSNTPGMAEHTTAAEASDDSDSEAKEREGHKDSLGSRWTPIPMPKWHCFDATSTVSLAAVEASAEDDLWVLAPASRKALLEQWLAAEVETAVAEVDDLLEQDSLLGARIAELERSKASAALKGADVVGCTITGAAIRVDLLREVGFRVAVVEEAAEILEPMLTAALPTSLERVLLIGDHQQLRPLLEEDQLGRDHGLDVSLMERLVRAQGFDFIQLTAQNRMRPEMTRLIGDIYPDLRTNLASVEGNVPPPIIKTPNGEGMFFVNTGNRHHSVRAEGGRGWRNPDEAREVADLARLLIDEGTDPGKITVLCAYQAQKALIRGLLQDAVSHTVVVETIDRYQGDENDIVLVSVARSGRATRFIDTRNRRCVGASRARSCVVFFGDADALRSTEAWKPMMQQLQSDELLATELPLHCPRHEAIRLPAFGRCKQRCHVELPCGHECGQPCHLLCPPCSKPVKDKFRACGHEVDRPCGTPIKRMQCKELVRFSRPCGHEGQRRCHEIEPPCVEQVAINCIRCGRDGRTTCSIRSDRPEDHRCMHPCRRTMRCGHPCSLLCGASCDDGLDGCEVCAEERRKAADERKGEIQRFLQQLKSDDYAHNREASESQRSEVEHVVRAYYVAAGLSSRVTQVRDVYSTQLYREFLASTLDCAAAPDPILRAVQMSSQSEAETFVREGCQARGRRVDVSKAADGKEDVRDTEERWLVMCKVQLGREDVRQITPEQERSIVGPRDGFDSIFNVTTEQHWIFEPARVLPAFLVQVEVSRAQNAAMLPRHWGPEDMPAQGWRCIPLPADGDDFKVLTACLKSDPKELGKGRDQVEGGIYTKLQLARAWRIENPRLWRRYCTERQNVKEEIQQRKIQCQNPRIRAELTSMLEKLPDPPDKEVHEVRLLHATQPSKVATLLNNGPNERFSGTNAGTMFGDGIYFAEDAGKNDQYVTRDENSNEQSRKQLEQLHRVLYRSSYKHPGKVYYLFLCRVVLGVCVRTKSGNERAKSTDGNTVFATTTRRELACVPGSNMHYHALVAELGGDIHRFREIVQFHDARIYPEYLLAYERRA